MKVECWDCGDMDFVLIDIPRNSKTEWKDTVMVCRDCFEKWRLKNEIKKRR